MPVGTEPGQDPNDDLDDGAGDGSGAGGTGADPGAGAGGASGAGNRPDQPPLKGTASGQVPDAKADSDGSNADYIRRLRTEAADTRKRLRDSEAKLKALEEANLSELDKAKRQAQQLTDELAATRQLARTAEIQAFVAGLGAVYPDVVARMADPEITDPKLAAQALKDAYPAYFKPEKPDKLAPSASGGAGAGAGNGGGTGADAGAGNRQPPKADMNSWIRDQALGGRRG